MPLTMRWVGEADYDLVAATRTLCYGPRPGTKAITPACFAPTHAAGPGDFLLAEDKTGPIGTATAFSMTTWVRGSPLPCQGVGYVGTIRTHRRGRGRPATIASPPPSCAKPSASPASAAKSSPHSCRFALLSTNTLVTASSNGFANGPSHYPFCRPGPSTPSASPNPPTAQPSPRRTSACVERGQCNMERLPRPLEPYLEHRR